MNNRKSISKEIEVLAKLIFPVLSEGGVLEASVFDSFVRGEAQPGSDLDRVYETIQRADTGIANTFVWRGKSLTANFHIKN